MWWRNQKKLKNLITFHSANKIDNYNREGKGGKKKQKENPRESTEQVKK